MEKNAAVRGDSRQGSGRATTSTLHGHLLMAVPGVTGAPFERTVIYLHTHSRNGAMGFVINRELPIPLTELVEQLGIESEGQSASATDANVRYGGPVDEQRGFVIHAAEKSEPGEGRSAGISVSTSMDMLRSIAQGGGPERAFLVLGYAGWAPGQLESEIAENAWFHAPASLDMVFSTDVANSYERALRLIGIRPEQMNGLSGHA
jgi:putative transcriptional regulator